MQLNSTEISELIKQRIAQFNVVSEAHNEGTIVSVSDGVIRIHGLADCMQGEMISLPGNRYAIALNLERDSVGAVVMGPYADLAEGMKVKCTGRILEVPVGRGLLGRVVNTLGAPIDGKGPVDNDGFSAVEAIAPVKPRWLSTPSSTSATPASNVSMSLSARKRPPSLTWCVNWKSTARWLTPLLWWRPRPNPLRCNIWRRMPVAQWANTSVTAAKMR